MRKENELLSANTKNVSKLTSFCEKVIDKNSLKDKINAASHV